MGTGALGSRVMIDCSKDGTWVAGRGVTMVLPFTSARFGMRKPQPNIGHCATKTLATQEYNHNNKSIQYTT